MKKEIEFLTLDGLVELSEINIDKINDVTLTEKDKEAANWIVAFYKDKINRIFNSDLVYFLFKQDAPLELTIYEEDYRLKRMVWVASSPLEVVAGINSRSSIRLDIRSQRLKIMNKEDIKVYPLQGELLFFDYGNTHHIISYDQVRYDKKGIFLNNMATAELYSMIRSRRVLKEKQEGEELEDKEEIDANSTDLIWEELEEEIESKKLRD